MTDGDAGSDFTLIKVIFTDNSAGVVKAGSLDGLITASRIVAFHRSDGWVTLGRDPIRGMGGKYGGPERRRMTNKAFCTVMKDWSPPSDSR